MIVVTHVPFMMGQHTQKRPERHVLGWKELISSGAHKQVIGSIELQLGWSCLEFAKMRDAD